VQPDPPPYSIVYSSKVPRVTRACRNFSSLVVHPQRWISPPPRFLSGPRTVRIVPVTAPLSPHSPRRSGQRPPQPPSSKQPCSQRCVSNPASAVSWTMRRRCSLSRAARSHDLETLFARCPTPNRYDSPGQPRPRDRGSAPSVLLRCFAGYGKRRSSTLRRPDPLPARFSIPAFLRCA